MNVRVLVSGGFEREEKPAIGGHFSYDEENSTKSAMSGWRRSADRTRLCTNSLLTGNFTGNFAIQGYGSRFGSWKTAVPQPLIHQFPTQINRERISRNSKFLPGNRDSSRASGQSSNRPPGVPAAVAESPKIGRDRRPELYYPVSTTSRLTSIASHRRPCPGLRSSFRTSR